MVHLKKVCIRNSASIVWDNDNASQLLVRLIAHCFRVLTHNFRDRSRNKKTSWSIEIMSKKNKPRTFGNNLQTAGKVVSAVGIILATIGGIILLVKRSRE